MSLVRSACPCSAARLMLPSFPTRRSSDLVGRRGPGPGHRQGVAASGRARGGADAQGRAPARRHRAGVEARSEEHTSELQSRENIVCRLLLEKKKNNDYLRQLENAGSATPA